MQKIISFFRSLDWRFLALLAIFAGLAPWPMGPEPHVVEKMRWLLGGYLNKPLDIFDLVFHLSPTILLVAKGVLRLTAGPAEASGSEQ